ncbi:hypothetical protein U1Q18_026285 [Sarracenia purpurea var. burkii]
MSVISLSKPLMTDEPRSVGVTSHPDRSSTRPGVGIQINGLGNQINGLGKTRARPGIGIQINGLSKTRGRHPDQWARQDQGSASRSMG